MAKSKCTLFFCAVIDFYNSKKFVINLAKRPDRWREFEAQAKNAGIINYERVEGIDGKLLPYNDVQPLPTGPRHLKLSRNQREDIAMSQAACRMSHLKCIELAKAENLPYAIIIEDDADFDVQIHQKLGERLPQLPENWQQVYFGAHNYRQLDMISPNVGKCVTTLSTICYAVNANSYDIFIEALKQDQVLDIIYCNYLHTKMGINAYCFFPNLVVQRKGLSDIEGIEIDYRQFYNKWNTGVQA